MRINQIIETQIDEIDRRGFLRGLGAAGAMAAVPSLAKAAGTASNEELMIVAKKIKSVFAKNIKVTGQEKPTVAGRFRFTFDMQGRLINKEKIESCGDAQLDQAVLDSATNITQDIVALFKPESGSKDVRINFGVGDGWWKAGIQNSQQPAQQTQQPQQVDLPKILEIGKRAVVDSLNDPDSGKIKDLKVYDTTDKKGNEVYLIIGRVNGKNRMGGYVGYKLFGVPIYKNNGKAGEVVHDSTRSGYDGVFINLWFGRAISDGKLIYSDSE